MELKISFSINESLFLKDPESTALGKRIIQQSIVLISELGFESFTFKKLANAINTTEPSIYRYFENKHRLLLYIINWYWSYLDYLMDNRIRNLNNPNQKLEIAISLLTQAFPEEHVGLEYDRKKLHGIVIAESSKVYLTKEVSEINRNKAFKPYKELCAHLAAIIQEISPNYPFAHSLSSTLIETAHHQQFFCDHLPSLTDITTMRSENYVHQFIQKLAQDSLRS
jgi:AcrR family transcriptional regulator